MGFILLLPVIIAILAVCSMLKIEPKLDLSMLKDLDSTESSRLQSELAKDPEKKTSRYILLQDAAENMGLSCSPSASLPFLEEFRICKHSDFHSIEFRNLVTAEVEDTKIMVFDMSVSSCNGFSLLTEQTVGLIQNPDLLLPAFDLEPLNNRSLSSIRFQRCAVEFLNDVTFGSVYRLRGNDGNAVRDKFDPAVRNHLIDTGGLYLEGRDDLLLYCFPAKLTTPFELQNFFSQGFDLMSLFTRQDVERECIANLIEKMRLMRTRNK